MDAYDRPLPRIGPDTAPFWEAARRGALAVPWCRDCARPHLPPGPVCPVLPVRPARVARRLWPRGRLQLDQGAQGLVPRFCRRHSV